LHRTRLAKTATDASPQFKHEIGTSGLTAAVCDARLGGVLESPSWKASVLARLVGFCTSGKTHCDAAGMLANTVGDSGYK
jgi:hypothetical protein